MNGRNFQLLIGLPAGGFLAAIVALCVASGARAEDHVLDTFERQALTDVYYSEGANAADINGDGAMDIVQGPYWFEGPAFTNKHEIYPAKPQDRNRYANSFFQWVYDFDGDGHIDVLTIGLPDSPAMLRLNPGPGGWDKPWKATKVIESVGNESPQFVNIVGDERPELVFVHKGRFGFAAPNWDKPLEPWKFTPISELADLGRFTHGLGVGDVNGDGRADIIWKGGWFEQPRSYEDADFWPFHEVQFAVRGGSDMFAYDVDGDGDNDVITSLAAHDFGLAWYEQIRNGEEITFKRHLIMGEKSSSKNRYGVLFSELHALDLKDIDGDGLKDIVTGKTYWSHHRKSEMWDAGAVVYWFRLVRTDDGVDWVPYKADGESGIGRQLTVVDVNGDSLPDIVAGGMVGCHVLIHKQKKVDEATWRRAQPKLKNEPASETSASDVSSDAPSGKVSRDAEIMRRRRDPAFTGGVLPKNEQGKALNLDFEKGTLEDWTAKGSAFTNQPVTGAAGSERSNDRVRHQGKYWVGAAMSQGNEPVGTLTSAPFEVTHRWATFLCGGGDSQQTRVELVLQSNNRLIYRYAGEEKEGLRPVVIDLENFLGEKIYLRIVDEHSGIWGHINFDNFRFHRRQPGPVTPIDEGLQKDKYPFAGLTAEKAAKEMKLPDGFTVLVGASEPEIRQPIAMALDDRGRVWVAEAYEYPVRAEGDKGRDRILVFEDADGDGKLEKRTVFAEGLNLVSGLEVGFGGVWVGAAPYLMFIPDRNGDDVPDGEPEILLDGWHFEDTHETLNAFIWGPDGWLYGCHGVFTHSLVGKPGAPEKDRVPLNAAIWRYHPTKHTFEVFAHGTSNPWGVDFNDRGQAFCTACVIPHLFHIIQNARYQRQAGQHFNPYTYDDIRTIADHRHYMGARSHAGNDKSDGAGGGHAHAGAMVYLGGVWPEPYRDQIFMNNIHGQRLNRDTLKARGSGYVGSHGPDFLLTGDRASQILNLRYGPDGQATMIDWYDMQACHSRDPKVHDRSNGRIYKIVYGKNQPVTVDLKQSSDLELAEQVLNSNDWYVRHARRILQERAAAGKLDAAVHTRLRELALNHPDETRRLRAMWALHVTGGLSEDMIARMLSDKNPYVRGWAIQLAFDQPEPPSGAFVDYLTTMARDDSSQVVRLYLASALQEMPHDQRWAILEGLVQHSEDMDDPNLPLMYWYAAEPLAEANPERALALAMSAGESMPLLRKFMLRRIGSSGTSDSLALLVRGLGKAMEVDQQLTFLRGIRTALRGQRQVDPPEAWRDVYARISESEEGAVRMQAKALGITFGDRGARESFRELAASPTATEADRREAIQSLLDVKDPKIVPTLHELIEGSSLQDIALRGLAYYNDPQTANLILAKYSKLAPREKRLAVATLCSRPSYALALLKAVEAKEIPSSDISADLVRQLQNLKDDQVNKLLTNVMGTVRETAADKKKLVAKYKELVADSSVEDPDESFGRAVFAKTCQRCHTLYGVGAKIGPDLTGSNRSDLEYLLSNVVDPSAVMAKEYQPMIVVTEDGLTITGIVLDENANAVTLQSADDKVVVPKDEILESGPGKQSMMPEDQLKQFSDHEIRSLVAYLQDKRQVPMLATKDTVDQLFNGKDLTGWTGNMKLWSVENGEIVGRSPGIKHNEFLTSDMAAEDFRLSLEVKLVDNAGNSGIQFRSKPNPDGHVKGYQADVGKNWWGKLYEELGRGLLWDKPGEQHVKQGEWNKYEIQADGSRIRTWINGKLCVDLEDPKGARRGIFALQIHSGPPMEVRFRNLKLEMIEKVSE